MKMKESEKKTWCDCKHDIPLTKVVLFSQDRGFEQSLALFFAWLFLRGVALKDNKN
jgi:hypothetical protein